MTHRARARVRRDRPRFQVTEHARVRLLEQFVAAIHARDTDALLALFAGDATWTSDGGGKAKAARKLVVGADRIARFLVGVWRKALPLLDHRLVSVNGESGLLMLVGGRPVVLVTIDTDGRRILSACAVLNPDKLRGTAALRLSA